MKVLVIVKALSIFMKMEALHVSKKHLRKAVSAEIGTFTSGQSSVIS